MEGRIVAVFGGTDFLGWRIVNALARRGCTVRLDALMKKDNVANADLLGPWHPRDRTAPARGELNQRTGRG
jgi:NAD(P)-dependent dehydrogenase (short-subunit alcohol dehydrogenase family)